MGIMQIIIANFLIKQYKIVKICLSNIKVGRILTLVTTSLIN